MVNTFSLCKQMIQAVFSDKKENFSGLLVPLLWKSMKANVQQGFEEMNKALKKRVERQAALNP